jgi:O-methyltransferase
MLRTIVKKVVNLAGYEVMQVISPDMDKEFLDIYKRCKQYTVTSIERMFALYMASKYVARNDITGDIVECGVWKGGSSMLCALTLKLMQETQRKLYLYDTFEGMTEPTEKDVNYKGEKAVKEEFNKWCSIPLGYVWRDMVSTGYPYQNFVFVKGKVEDTIPRNIPEKIALLRLDTDFYESTYHEMVHLFPRLVAGGVLIIDDYGHFKGAREAVDKYLRENNVKILLNRIDYTGRIGVKI